MGPGGGTVPLPDIRGPGPRARRAARRLRLDFQPLSLARARSSTSPPFNTPGGPGADERRGGEGRGGGPPAGPRARKQQQMLVANIALPRQRRKDGGWRGRLTALPVLLPSALKKIWTFFTGPPWSVQRSWRSSSDTSGPRLEMSILAPVDSSLGPPLAAPAPAPAPSSNEAISAVRSSCMKKPPPPPPFAKAARAMPPPRPRGARCAYMGC
mmetsp:Transcript_21552/g.54369  ORF Transcript_21552/g.54369 Transcript_21552/m.54369 type:complete len:212 (-) Transcript_21552:168-803(-)